MRINIFLLSLLLGLPAMAVEAPPVSKGDFLFIKGRIVGCELGTTTIDFAEVDENGQVNVLDDISLSVAGKAVYQVTSDLADILEKRWGYRPKTLEVHWVPGSDKEQIAKRLLFFATIKKPKCRQILEPDESPPGQDYSRIAFGESFRFTHKGEMVDATS